LGERRSNLIKQPALNRLRLLHFHQALAFILFVASPTLRNAEVRRSDRLMGYSANIQWIFYRRGTNDDYLLKVLYNEHPIHLPITTTQYPYYSWKAVREYYLHKLHTINADPGRDMYSYLQTLR